RRPLIRSSTSRAFCGETLVNRAFAVNSIVVNLYSLPRLSTFSSWLFAELLSWPAGFGFQITRLPNYPITNLVRPLALPVAACLLPAWRPQSPPDRRERPPVWPRLPLPPSSSAP